jgi:hypothetical protein
MHVKDYLKSNLFFFDLFLTTNLNLFGYDSRVFALV